MAKQRTMPFKPVDATVETYYHVEEAMAVQEAADRIKEILDAKYEAADLEKVCSSQSHLLVDQQKQLLKLLNSFVSNFANPLTFFGVIKHFCSQPSRVVLLLCLEV